MEINIIFSRFRNSEFCAVYTLADLNPIPAGVLENLCPNMTNDTSIESSCALFLESAKKFANLQKLNFLSQNPVK